MMTDSDKTNLTLKIDNVLKVVGSMLLGLLVYIGDDMRDQVKSMDDRQRALEVKIERVLQVEKRLVDIESRLRELERNGR